MTRNALRLTPYQAAGLKVRASAPSLPLPGLEPPKPKRAKRLKLQRQVVPEEAIQAAIGAYLDLLMARRVVAFWVRQNGGAMSREEAGKKRRWVPFYFLHGFGPVRSKGVGDIWGMLWSGRFFAIEVKRQGEKATMEQAEYLSRVEAAGGLALLADDVAVVQRAIPIAAGG